MQALNADQEVIYRFEGYELDPARRRLSKGGEAMQLTPKAFDTLLVLVRNRGRVITKDELMQAVWPDTIVEETNLAHNISTLRKLLGQKGGDNRFIITAPGRGYQFVAEVRQQARGAENLGSATEQADVALVTSRPETIAPPVANASPSQTSRQAPALLITKHHVSFRWRTALSVIIILGLVAVAGLIWR